MSDNKEAWSEDGDYFNWESLECLVDGNIGKFNPGDTVYVGIAKAPQLSELCDADDVIELMMNRATEIGGEYADDFMPDVTDEAKADLAWALKIWMEKHVTVNFFTVENVREYILTEEDLLETEQNHEEDAHKEIMPKAQTMIINFKNRCLWHSDCENHFGGIMKEIRHEEDKTLMECLHCGKKGYYPKGGIGRICVEIISCVIGLCDEKPQDEPGCTCLVTHPDYCQVHAA